MPPQVRPYRIQTRNLNYLDCVDNRSSCYWNEYTVSSDTPQRDEFPRMTKVTRRKTRDWKQSFRFVPETVKTKVESLSGDIQLGAVKSVGLSEIGRGDYRHLEVEIDQSGRIQVPDDLVLPPKEMGIWSERNIEGWEEKLEHRPKVEFTNIIESPNWGDWSRGSHFVEMRGLRYPRKVHNPRLCRFRVELLGQEGESVFKFLFLIEEPFDSQDAELEDWLFESGQSPTREHWRL